MDVDVSCIDCNDEIEVIEEWTDWHGNHLKVKPCDHVTAELAKCQRQRDALAETCNMAFEFLKAYFAVIEYDELVIAKKLGFTELMNRLALAKLDE